MASESDVQEALRAATRPMGTAALAVLLDSHWSIVSELLYSLERKGEVTWQGEGWTLKPAAVPSTEPPVFHAPALLVRPNVPNPAQP